MTTMPNDEITPPTAPLRYVPTLTEVVTDAGLPAGAAAARSTGAQGVSVGVTAEQVLALMGSDLDQRISEAIAQALHEQMLGLNARVRRAVADVVQDAVDTAVRRVNDGRMSG